MKKLAKIKKEHQQEFGIKTPFDFGMVQVNKIRSAGQNTNRVNNAVYNGKEA